MNNNINYSYFHKDKFNDLVDLESISTEYDIFISTYNPTDRVRDVYGVMKAKNKFIIVLPEDAHSLFLMQFENRVELQYDDYEKLIEFIDNIVTDENTSICIDITGFIIPHMLFVIRYLHKAKNIKNIDMIYTEPKRYVDSEKTLFSDGYNDVTQIIGYGSIAQNTDMSNDMLIVSSGYDGSRITDVANKKRHARKVQLFGFPPLQADMFQENIINAYKAESAIGSEGFKNLDLNLYSPANDPFVTAEVLKKYIQKEQEINGYFTNIYLAPVSTKPHALGFGIFYIWETYYNKNIPMSIIYPTCNKHYTNTTEGISKIWRYTVELP